MINGVMIYFLSLLFPISAFATFTYTQDFESQTLDQRYPADGTGCSDNIYWSYTNPKANCDAIIKDDIPARYGTKYLDVFCNWVDSTDNEVKKSQRAQTTFGLPSGWSPCNEMKYNDGTEYWFGWSIYIPSDYYEEYYSHMFFEFTTTSMSIPLALYFGGGETQNGTPNHSWRRCAYYDGGLHCGDFSNDNDWRDEKGQWVDIVIQARFYTTDNANATIKVWKNGVIQYSRSGGDNTTGGVIFSAPMLYNIYAYPGYAWYDDDPKKWHKACDDGLTSVSKWREVPADELRITEGSSGTYNYCSVAPPIVAATPSVTYPTPGLTGIATTFTSTFSGYSDERSDAQSCFGAYKTQVQVDESGGNWSSLVYDSGSVNSTTSHQVTGLANNTAYQIRVRHSSYNTTISAEYWGRWSNIVTFTTGTGSDSGETSSPPLNDVVTPPQGLKIVPQ